MLAETRRLQERAAEMIGTGEDAPEKAVMLLERARNMLTKAESAIAQGKNDEAVRMMEEARRTLRRAVEESKTDIDPQLAAEEVERAAELGETVRATLERCEAEGARNLYERANEHIVRARENLDRGLRDRAVAEARIARNLFNRVREICVQ
jgi:HEPN domain-containing protein